MPLLRLKRIIYILSFFTILSGCSHHNQASALQNNERSISTDSNTYICIRPEQYINTYVGSGECVDLIKRCTNAPNTSQWKKGSSVFGKNITKGTAIATFKRSKYPNKKGYHTAIFSHQNTRGIFVWDQWRGQKVHQRFIWANQPHKNAANDASRYSIIVK